MTSKSSLSIFIHGVPFVNPAFGCDASHYEKVDPHEHRQDGNERTYGYWEPGIVASSDLKIGEDPLHICAAGLLTTRRALQH